MSPFTKPLRLFGPDGIRTALVEALVDTGSSYSMVPGSLLLELCIEAQDEFRFRLGDERLRLWPVAQMEVEIQGRRTYTWMIFGDEGSQPISRAPTLEGTQWMVDPPSEQLLPFIGLLK